SLDEYNKRIVALEKDVADNAHRQNDEFRAKKGLENGPLVIETKDRIAPANTLELYQLRERVRQAQVEADTLDARDNPDPAARQARIRYERYRQELADLESRLTQKAVDALKQDLTTLKSQLEDLERQHGPEHPDVIRLKNRIEDTERDIEKSNARPAESPS